MKAFKLYLSCYFLVISLFILLVCPDRDAFGKGLQISGKYTAIGQTSADLEITVSTPHPVSIIVIQRVQGKTTISSSSPPPAKLSKTGKSATYLFRGVYNTTIRISTRFSRPYIPGTLSATLRFRGDNGKMRERIITP